MSFLKKHDIHLKVLAVLIALFMWSYVVLTQNPTKSVHFSGVPVTLSGVAELEERGLMLVTEGDAKVDVNVTGTSTDMAMLNSGSISAVVDFSDIQEASTYYMQPTVTVPKSASVSYKPQRLQFAVENIVSKDVPVRVTTMNDLAGDRLVDELRPSQRKVTVTGAESAVATVEYALLTVDLQDISRNMAQTCRVTLYSDEDTLVESPHVTANEQTIDVTVGLNHIVSASLNVTLVSSAELSRDMVNAQITPESVRVFGPQESVTALSTLSLGSIDLAEVRQDGQEFTLPIKLPAGVRLMKGEPESVRVKIVMRDDVVRTVNVTDITLNDTSTAEQKPEVSLSGEPLAVELRGKPNLLADVTGGDIRAEVSFDSSELGAGVHTVSVKLTVSRSGVSLVSNTMETEITIEAQEEADEPN